ncbi:inositol-3-phosphate synthase [Bradymonas sediminis]|uniref:inositol-3-phosphate synthase n=1 Tax=Bradymonas sediminis TaxID=1548548 RepID=UPI0010D6CD30|nr:inositol-3-phosphate synthase [Bradymonas sediminis]TDP73733.1 myo-inositol-1-phosphate synthase [Bradymonas sediminis]
MNRQADYSTNGKTGGKLAVLLPGLGAVGTTFIAGAIAARRGLGAPIGSLTQLGRMPVSADAPDAMPPRIKDVVGLAELDDLVFGGWDIFEDNCYEAACNAGVLTRDFLAPLQEELEAIRPMKAVFDPAFVRNITGPNVKKYKTKMDAAEALVADIERFMAQNGCARAVGVWCGSTEVFVDVEPVHASLKAFEAGLRGNDDAISPTMIYAYAHIKAGVPFINSAPNRALNTPALVEMAEQYGVPFAGHDLKTGQTLMKTILAPGIASRQLGVSGWYSTNILGNRDGLVLDDPGSFKTKEESKLSVLDSIFRPDQNPQLYGDMHHKVRIDYYPPRGDAKEGWDNIDIFGWMGYPMQIKVNFLCRDSILAAPLVLDLALLADLAQRKGQSGNQTWLSYYFKSPQADPGEGVVHALMAQERMLFTQLRILADADVSVDHPWDPAILPNTDSRELRSDR